MDHDIIIGANCRQFSKAKDTSFWLHHLLIRLRGKALKTNYWKHWKPVFSTIYLAQGRSLEQKCSPSVMYGLSVSKWTESYRFFSANNRTVMQIMSSRVWNAPIRKKIIIGCWALGITENIHCVNSTLHFYW